MNVDLITTIIKIFSVYLISILIFIKINNLKEINFSNKVLLFFLIIALTAFYIILKRYLDIIAIITVLYFLQSIIIKMLTKINISNILVSNIISISTSYFLLIVSGFIEFLFQKYLKIDDKILNVLLTIIIEFILIYVLGKTKRIKNGLSFLKNDNVYINIAIINISSVLLLAYIIFGNYYGNLTRHIFFGFIILGGFMIIIIQETLILNYKQNIIKNTFKSYEETIKQQNLQIQDLEAEKYNISKITHEFYNRQKALEMFVKENMKTESAEELSLLNKIQDLTNEYSQRIKDIKTLPELELTGIKEIDNMFKYMQKECYDNNIEFNLKISGNIYYLVNNIIPKNKLETMIGDHIRDAIIAVNSSKNNNREIFVILGVKDKKYELCIYDTGIEFEIVTLVKLGTKPITTHKDTGGSGIGFMTTFETLNQTKASLIIKENPPTKENHYTKAVIIRFDNLNQYKICSYRVDEIEKNKKGRNIVIEKI